MIVREAAAADAPALAAIYGHYVLESVVTFEETPPSAAEMAERLAAVRAHRLPYVVAETPGEGVVGLAYASPFRARASYRYTAEDTVYLRPDFVGRGLGKRLVGEVIGACEALGLRQLVAVIGDSANAGSIGLHRSLGFTQSGVCEGFGYKLGRWVDVVLMQRALNGGAEGAPGPAGLIL